MGRIDCPVGGQRGVGRDNLAFRLYVSAAAVSGAICGVSTVDGTVAGSDAWSLSSLARVDVQFAVVAGWDGRMAGLGNNWSLSSLARIDVEIAVAVG